MLGQFVFFFPGSLLAWVARLVSDCFG